VLVDPDHPDGAQALLVDQVCGAPARLLLLGGQQAVLPHEAVLANSP
jgi:hypothetical protein